MELNKNGLVCKIAFLNSDIPKNISLCDLFWKFIFNLCGIPIVFVCCVLQIISVGVFAFMLISSHFLIGFFFAERPAIFQNDDSDRWSTEYKKWPRVQGKRVWPIWLVLIYFVAMAHEAIFDVFLALTWVFICWQFYAVLLFAALITILAIIILKPKKTEAFTLFAEYIKAKKQKICPLIEIK